MLLIAGNNKQEIEQFFIIKKKDRTRNYLIRFYFIVYSNFN